MKPFFFLDFPMIYKLVLLFLGLQISFAQETPPIINFSPIVYGAENQNWDITQNFQKFIYVANNDGLLEYNGSKWTLYPSPNNTVIRSIASFEDKIYTGSFMEFGYWTKNHKGLLEYQSLSEDIKTELFEDEIIWNISKLDKFLIFQSYDRIYFYDTVTNQINFVTDKRNNYRLFEVNQNIYVQKYDGRILKIENGKESLIAKIPDALGINYILSMFSLDNQLVVLTRTKGLFKIKDKNLSKWNIPADTLLDKSRIFSGIQLKDKSLVLGTISQGIITISKEGRITNTINQSKGLSNNTVLNLFEDADGNIWTALDNGLDCINMQSYIQEYYDKDGTVGTTYASVVHNQKLYIGTNQGLFYKKLNSNDNLELIKGTKGQVWSLYVHEKELLCGHNSGIFLVEDTKASLITNIAGVWNFRTLPNHQKKLMFGHYSGLAFISKQNKSWQLDHKIRGFEISSRFFEIMEADDIWVNHEYKGVYRLKLNKDLKSFDEVELLSAIPKGKGSGMIKVGKDLLYSNGNGIFKINNSEGIQKDSLLSDLIPHDGYNSGKLVFDEKERLWSFNLNTIGYAQKGPLNNMVSTKFIPIEHKLRKTTLSFENISHLSGNRYILGKTNGYLLIDLDKIINTPHEIFLDDIEVRKMDNNFIKVSKKGDGEFTFNQSSIRFNYSVPHYDKYADVTFQYRLKGFQNEWSDWNEKSSVAFEKLSFGNYVFEVKSKIGNRISNNISEYRFTIARPFYLSNLALLGYLLLAAIIIVLIHKSYKRYYRLQNEKVLLENQRQLKLQTITNEQEMVKLKNDTLNQEIESKNRELAISTMSIIKRNEVLRTIKKELKKNTDLDSKTHPVFKMIDKNLNSSKDKKFFMQAFNNADKDFLKRAKSIHPELSPNDLKFCAYLRLNLSSKEIAPLLNISVKSVEVRRSRLRKKLSLSRDSNLIDYILSI
ncbi:triple tyrosine motif-containing protein [Maribacter sp. 2210JD10-5]|uniref:helix-turn-helix and ligand-binding sensor domain-containing protein n=1 Tax=Maribacter sp. 2210JD10-5 TaxID=3386272 RepID=UPI0039BD5001